LAELRFDANGRSVPVFDSRGVKLRSAFRHARLPITFQSYVRTVPLGRFADGDLVFLPHVTFAVNANPQSFPLDTYAVSFNATMDLPQGLSLNGRRTIDPSIDAGVDPDLEGYDFGLYILRGRLFHSISPVAVVVSRDDVTRIFAILLALTPLLLIAALVVAVVSLRPRESGRDLVTGAAAILVALLPIRAVLVPSDLPGITLVDLALGWEVGLLTALTAWTASNLIGGTRRSAVVKLEADGVRSETSNEENACDPGSTTDADSTARPGEPPPTA
jgi:Domain of unknown function (DUF4436)